MKNIYLIMYLRSSLLIISVFIFSIVLCNAQWSIEKCPTRNNLNAVTFLGNGSGWVVGDSGTILHKAGPDWIITQPPTKENIYSISMIDKNNGWAVGAEGTILRFDGFSWQKFSSPTKSNLFHVYFIHGENGIAVGESGTILRFRSGVWDVVDKEIKGSLFTAFLKNDCVWIGGGLECVNVPIMKMTYDIDMKINETYDSYVSIYDIYFQDYYNGWAVGSPGILLHYSGFSWQRTYLDEKIPSLNAIYFQDENNGICVGYEGTILTFSEGKWIREKSRVPYNLKGTTIIGDKYYAVGDKGTIITKHQKVSDAETSMIKQNEMIWIYPNPCNEYLEIILPSENNNATYLISITNTVGQVIKQKLINLVGENTTYSIITRDLKDGLYILQANTGGKIASKRFIVEH